MKKETGLFYNPVSDFSITNGIARGDKLFQNLGKQRSRVKLFTVLMPQFKMKDRTVHVSGRTNLSDFLARCDFIAFLNEDFIANGIKRHETVVMIEQHVFRISIIIGTAFCTVPSATAKMGASMTAGKSTA